MIYGLIGATWSKGYNCLQQHQRHCEDAEGGRGNLFEITVRSRGWLTGNVLLPALRAHCMRPKSLPAILSSGFALLAMTLVFLRCVGRPATHHCLYNPDLLDRIRIDLVRIFLEDDEIGELACDQ